MSYYIGIDLGGTDLKVGIVTESGSIVSTHQTPTLPQRPYQEIVRDMATEIDYLLNENNLSHQDIVSIGIGIPGVADQKQGRVIFCTNLGWRDIPLKDELQKYINRPVHIDNDATVAGYAESICGISKDSSCSVFLTLGTGVGAGIVVNGRPWSGAHGVGSEIGHMTLVVDGVPCTCGNDGCVERYCSATAIVRMAKQASLGYPECDIMARANNNAENITAKMVIDSAKAGDSIALRIFDRYCKYLAIAINNITAFMDPEMIVLGGGVSKAGDFLLENVRSQLPRYLMYKNLPSPRLELALLGNDAGIIGAALLGK